jgi:hypothetical protein
MRHSCTPPHLNDGIQEQQMDMYSHPDCTREMIPQFLWAKIKARRHFFLQTCTKAMLDVPRTSLPTVAKAKLSAHTLMFLNDIKVSIKGVPPQWLGHDDKPGPAKKARHENTESERHSKSDETHNQSTPPQRGRGSEVAGTNMSGPPSLHNCQRSMTSFANTPPYSLAWLPKQRVS